MNKLRAVLADRIRRLRLLLWLILATLVLCAVMVGVPLFLVRSVGNPLPTAVPEWAEVSQAVRSGRIDSWTWVKTLALVAWLAWANLATSFVVEIWAQLRGRTARAVRGLGATQWLAARVVAQCTLAGSLIMPSSPAAGVSAMAGLPLLDVPSLQIDEEPDGRFAGATPVVDGPSPSTSSAAAPTSTVTSPPAPTPTSSAPGTAGPASVGSPEPLTVEVARRGTLWGLAEEHLGDGARWEVIRNANVGRTMADGTTLPADFTRLEVGWQLVIPGSSLSTGSNSPSGAGRPVASIEVQQGDTLWGLASEQLSGPEAPTDAQVAALVDDIVDANQPAIDDPDVIRTGQVLTLPPLVGPGTGTVVPTNEPVETPTAPVVDPVVPPAMTVPEPTASDPRAREDRSSAQPSDAGDDGHPLTDPRLLGVGVGSAVLAAWVVRRLRHNRRYRLSHRTPGMVPTSSADDLRRAERALLWHAEEPTSTWLQAALASLAGRPLWEGEAAAQPLLVQLTDELVQVEFTSADAMAGPVPWTTDDDGRSWTLDRSTAVDDLPCDPTRISVPTLVTVGVDTMLNLEAIGLLRVDGSGDGPASLLRSIVHELANAPAAGIVDVRTTLPITGTDGYPLVRRQSPRRLVAELLPWLEQTEAEFDRRSSANAFTDRLQPDHDPVGPVVIVTNGVGAGEMAPLLTYANRRRFPLAVLVVASDLATEYVIDVDTDRAIVHPWDLMVEPQLLTKGGARHIERLLEDAAVTTEQPLPRPRRRPSEVLMAQAPTNGSSQPVHPPPIPTAPTLSVELSEHEVESDHDVESEHEVESEREVESVCVARPAQPAELEIRVLGDVEVDPDGPELTSQQLSLLCYLACNGSSTKAAIVDALWDGQAISKSRFPNLLAEVRAKVGRDHFPEARGGRYELSSVTTDLERFEHGLAEAGERAGPAAADVLRPLMELVRGVPLTPPAARFWSWVGDHSHMAARVEAMVADAAARLARLERDLDDLEGARRACEQGLLASPTDETLVTLLTEVYLELGKPGQARRVVEGWEEQISRLECGEPSEEPRKRLVVAPSSTD